MDAPTLQRVMQTPDRVYTDSRRTFTPRVGATEGSRDAVRDDPVTQQMSSTRWYARSD